MQQLHPVVRDTDVHVLYGSQNRPRLTSRPWIILSMISSADGAVSIDGVSGGLGGPADRAVFRHLRSIADGVIVGAETVRQESYSPLPAHQQLTVVSTSRNLGEHSDILLAAGNTSIVSGDVHAICTSLSGNIWVLEGGPTLNAQMLAQDCVDEVCLTISPRFVGGDTQRIVTGSELDDSTWDVAHIAHQDGFVFVRYLRVRSI
jgi:riboflavin biosynthesis pyrimidine reductase